MVVMVVGIGFGSLLIGSVAERFVAPGASVEVDEVGASEADLRRELREVGERLRRLEAALQQRRS
jgi:hypothetical protein